MWLNQILLFHCSTETKTGNSRFTMIHGYYNWFNAVTYCQQHYTDIAVINNTQDQQYLTSFAGLSWIGLIAVQWSDNTISQFRYWKAGIMEYTNVNNCVAMDMADGGKWNSTECDLLKPFVCYGGECPVSPLMCVFMVGPSSFTLSRVCNNADGFCGLPKFNVLCNMCSQISPVIRASRGY